jgi:hypothetical protein
MSSRLYGDHFIMAFPSFDTASNGWVPQADISWNHKSPDRKFAFIRFPNRCKTEAEAIDAALEMAEAWIDKHGSGLQRHAITSEPRQVIDVAEFLKESLAKVTGKQPRRCAPAPQQGPKQSFTFGHFKAAIAERGLQISDQTLQKSYAALLKLRKPIIGLGPRRERKWNSLSRSSDPHIRQCEDQGLRASLLPNATGAKSDESRPCHSQVGIRLRRKFQPSCAKLPKLDTVCEWTILRAL